MSTDEICADLCAASQEAERQVTAREAESYYAAMVRAFEEQLIEAEDATGAFLAEANEISTMMKNPDESVTAGALASFAQRYNALSTMAYALLREADLLGLSSTKDKDRYLDDLRDPS